jgi:hypothetical protein
MILGFLAGAGFCSRPAQAQVEVDLQIIDNVIYYISDFDIIGGGRPVEVFSCAITGAPRSLKLRVLMSSDRYPAPLLEALTRPFAFSGNLLITYRDFRNTNPDLSIERFTYNSEQLGALGDAILRTGQLPSGRYDITVQALDPSGALLGQDTKTLIINNPIALDLISPGQNASTSECPTLFSPLPQFTWNSDADKFLITVCEQLPTNSSPEDVMQNPPRVRTTLNRNQDFFGAPTFQYPTGGLPLAPGRAYYWQVLALVQTASGEVQLPSEIWCFKIHSNDQAQSNLHMQQLLNWLASSGLQDLLTLFQPGGPLAGFAPTGKVIMNGKSIDLAELLVLLQNGAIKAKAYNVE